MPTRLVRLVMLPLRQMRKMGTVENASENLVERLRVLLCLNDSQDYNGALLEELLSDAKDCILNYCNRDVLPARLQGAQLRLAVVFYNRLGTEGESSRDEGEISRKFDTEIPVDIRTQLERYVLAEVISDADGPSMGKEGLDISGETKDGTDGWSLP